MAVPQLPEMVFHKNMLKILHKNGCGIQFNAKDALICVSPEPDNDIKVAATEIWRASR